MLVLYNLGNDKRVYFLSNGKIIIAAKQICIKMYVMYESLIRFKFLKKYINCK